MNEPIVWQANYSVGIQVIDEQHQHMIEIINMLFRDLETKTGEIDVNQFFSEVESYGSYHFQTEETFFSRYNYPERSEHLAAHAWYREKVQSLLATDGPSRDKASTLLAFLKTWWVEHITGMDQTLRELNDQSPNN